MKRLLKPTGSIYVHLDWHASHYVKVEMDKIFGYDNFRNEIIWAYSTSGRPKDRFPHKHDVILCYGKSEKTFFNLKEVKVPYSEEYIKTHFPFKDENGKLYRKRYDAGKWRIYYADEGMIPNDVWDIPYVNSMSPERLGYPTQKPEALLERIIKASSKAGDVVADFFVGGGTTPAVAQRLGRHWIVSDISRIAVEITKSRILKVIKEMRETIDKVNLSNIEIISWGYYDISSLTKLSEEEFKNFVLEAFGARKISDPFIHGIKQGIPVWIGPKDNKIRVDENPVLEFAEYLEKYYENRKKGIMIAWQFSERAKQAQEMLAKLGAGIDFVNIDLIPIGSDKFKTHIVEKNENYAGFLRFIMPPVVRVRITKISDKTYEFDFSESVSLNNGKIINIQADFDFDGIFVPSTGFAITGGRNKENKLILKNKFSNTGKIKVAFKIEDDQGGEALIVKEIEVD